MKKISLLSLLSFLMISGILSAQSNDTSSAKILIEKGTKVDIILGKEYRQKQLNASPLILQSSDFLLKKESAINSKKGKLQEK